MSRSSNLASDRPVSNCPSTRSVVPKRRSIFCSKRERRSSTLVKFLSFRKVVNLDVATGASKKQRDISNRDILSCRIEDAISKVVNIPLYISELGKVSKEVQGVILLDRNQRTHWSVFSLLLLDLPIESLGDMDFVFWKTLFLTINHARVSLLQTFDSVTSDFFFAVSSDNLHFFRLVINQLINFKLYSISKISLFRCIWNWLASPNESEVVLRGMPKENITWNYLYFGKWILVTKSAWHINSTRV